MTERLYEIDPMLTSCTSTVLACENSENGWLIELDRTVLFPEGGGQLCDQGTINGADVTYVFEDNGKVFHLCARQFPVDSVVTVSLNRELRLFHSQQHTGEHILSHAFWTLFGAKNIGFHSGEQMITIDLDMELSREQCAQAERYANEQIWRNAKVNVLYRYRNDMADLNVRKVTDKVDGLLRIVAIDGGDVCTCCGTHVEYTGSVGMIKIASIQRHRSGTRLEVLCGNQALEDYITKSDLIYRLSCNLSCGTDSMEERIESLKAESRMLNTKLHSCSAKLMNLTAIGALRECREHNGIKCIMFPLEGTAKEAKQLMNQLTAEGSILAGVFYADAGRVGYMISKTSEVNLSCREISVVANGLLNGKGGGNDSFAQGSGKLTNDWRDLVKMIEEVVLRMM